MLEGTIIKGVGGQYTVHTANGQYICNARGLFRKQNISPIIGDRVQVKPGFDSDSSVSVGMLMEILPRTNKLRRPKVANVDQVVVVLSLTRPDFSFNLLDRYLIQAEHTDIDAIVCINKADLESKIKIADIINLYNQVGYPTFELSTKTGIGIERLREHMQGKTTVLAGPSGVGKSSIINKLALDATLVTGSVSEKIGRGKHTTRHTEFIPISMSGYAIDTPGFSSLEPPDVPKIERAALFREFRPWLGGCRFNDCLHQSEADCAVKEQIGTAIDPRRYERYLEWIVQ